jgi:hypothetical protein
VKILLCPHNWYHPNCGIAGGEVYLHRLTQYLLKQGHEIQAIVDYHEPYTHQGIKCHPKGEMVDIFKLNNDLIQWCDVIITQLIGTPYGYNKGNQHKKPIVFIAHNNSKSYPIKWGYRELTHVIYNSNQLVKELESTLSQFNGIVLHPLLSDYSKGGSKYVTLINCNYYKGGGILTQLATLLPTVQFLGVLGGYGEQITCEISNNITYLPNGSDMEQAYADTAILLVPSEFESYSQSAMEAMQCGIPVIAHPTPGLKENLSYAGIFIDRNDINKYKETIVYLGNETAYKEQSAKCLQRSAEQKAENELELKNVNDWLKGIVK